MNYTEQEWIDLMRSDPTNAGYMLLFADWLSENGRELEGEAIRLLGETGKVGKSGERLSFRNGYYPCTILGLYDDDRNVATIPYAWFLSWGNELNGKGLDRYEVVNMRLALAKVYAERATPEEREQWQRELRRGAGPRW